VANDDGVVSQMRVHQECWELLPWVINGRLSTADATRVSQHLQECSRCSEELHVQQQLCEALRREDPVLLAPQSSLRKLWQRFDAPAHSHPTHSVPAQSHSAQSHSAPSHDQAMVQTVQECVPATAVPSPTPPVSGLSRRMLLALAAQALLIVGLLAWSSWQTFERWQAPRFVTLTTPGTLGERQAAVRVVFVADTMMKDVNELLRTFQAEMLAGPNSAGVFTLGIPRKADADAIAKRLRANPHVQFAESTAVSVPP
jgi:hypothetical protein